LKLNLASLKSIQHFAESFKSRHNRLDVLLNNAGIILAPFGLTEDGFERTMGINHLGHFALTGLLMDLVKNTPGARIVNVSSNAHYAGEIDWNHLVYEGRQGFTPMKAYRRSKLANLLFTFELQRRFEKTEIEAAALAAHPGITATGLADHILKGHFVWIIKGVMKILFQSAAMGALPSLRAAVDPDAKGGQYFGPDGPGEKAGYPVVVDSTQYSKDPENARRLWEISQELTGIHYLS
jgi:NAD(P)-dependent dehydrogenase (short-subunit alcohol dehydrogenase family)